MLVPGQGPGRWGKCVVVANVRTQSNGADTHRVQPRRDNPQVHSATHVARSRKGRNAGRRAVAGARWVMRPSMRW